jgi:predicted aconitase
MTLSLTSQDREMLSGARGAVAKMAMSIVVRMAEVSGAAELLDITGAHIDSTVYIGDAGLEFAERLSGLGAKVAVPTTLNVSGPRQEIQSLKQERSMPGYVQNCPRPYLRVRLRRGLCCHDDSPPAQR